MESLTAGLVELGLDFVYYTTSRRARHFAGKLDLAVALAFNGLERTRRRRWIWRGERVTGPVRTLERLGRAGERHEMQDGREGCGLHADKARQDKTYSCAPKESHR